MKPPTKTEILDCMNTSISKQNFKFHNDRFPLNLTKYIYENIYALYCNVKKNSKKNLNTFRNFQSRTFKNNRVITSNISIILKPKRSFYDDLFKRYRFHRLTNLLTY